MDISAAILSHFRCFYRCYLFFLAVFGHIKTAPFLLVLSNFWGAVQILAVEYLCYANCR